jgi:hypothetical protein
MLTAIRRASSLVSCFVVEIDLAVVSSGPDAGPKAKENGRSERERNHNCVPQRQWRDRLTNLVNEFLRYRDRNLFLWAELHAASMCDTPQPRHSKI